MGSGRLVVVFMVSNVALVVVVSGISEEVTNVSTDVVVSRRTVVAGKVLVVVSISGIGAMAMG